MNDTAIRRLTAAAVLLRAGSVKAALARWWHAGEDADLIADARRRAEQEETMTMPPWMLTAVCECSHHWSVHSESGQTARSAICRGWTLSATPGPSGPCRCTGFRPWERIAALADERDAHERCELVPAREHDGTAFASWLDSVVPALFASDAALARAVGAAESTVMRWRRGTVPSVPYLLKLSRATGTSVETLLTIAGYRPEAG